MELKDFEFDLPEGLIAQYPLGERDSSRLMVVDRRAGAVLHRHFRDIKEFLRPGDLLVLNDTRVIPARLPGKKATGGAVEVLLVEKTAASVWRCLVRNSKGIKPGSRLSFDKGVEAVAIRPDAEGMWVLRFPEGFEGKIEELGKVPLPPYIRREPVEEDKKRYQTVFAGPEGAVAAPTAGLHFTNELLAGLSSMGIEVRYVTLHTGPGTFMPVRVKELSEHRVLTERYSITNETFEAVKRAKKEGRRIVAVGTTSTRALEASAINGFDTPALEGHTGLFIFPGFRFKVVDSLVTNFHLPGSTLLMLVSAFAGHGLVMDAYKKAVEENYRFFSYGDAMLIV